MKVKRYINRDPYEQLAAAIVYQAVIDARRGDLLALDWLAGDECRAYCEFIGMDWQIIRAYTPGGMDGKPSRINGQKTDICPAGPG